MSHIDELRQVLVGCYDGPDGFARGTADAILAATYPPACQTCGGAEIVTKVSNTTSDHDMGAGQWQERCPDCPTIAQLLAWGIAVATDDGLDYVGRSSRLAYAGGWNDCLADLRAVKP